MICVLKQDATGAITGWMMGSDMHDLRRRAQQTFDHELAGIFYRMEFAPQPGKHELAPGLTMLVAQGIEAGTAGTTEIGPVHESPVAESDAPKDAPTVEVRS